MRAEGALLHVSADEYIVNVLSHATRHAERASGVTGCHRKQFHNVVKDHRGRLTKLMAYMYRLLSAATSRRGYKLFRQQLINMGLDRLDGEEMFPTDKQVDREVRKLLDTALERCAPRITGNSKFICRSTVL